MDPRISSITSPLEEQVVKHQADLSVYPPIINTKDRGPDWEVTVGDLHGNAIKAIYFLISEGILQISKEDYERLFAIYNRFAFETTMRGPNPITKSKTVQELRAEIREFRTLLQKSTIDEIGAQILARFIGDEVADRGKCDLFYLFLREKLNQHKQRNKVAISNHGYEYIFAYEVGENLTSPLQDQALSMHNMNRLIEMGVVTRKEVLELIDNHYKPSLVALDYTWLENGDLTIHTHAAVGLNNIIALAVKLKIPVKLDEQTLHDSPHIDQVQKNIDSFIKMLASKDKQERNIWLAQLIDQINIEFKKHVMNNTVHQICVARHIDEIENLNSQFPAYKKILDAAAKGDQVDPESLREALAYKKELIQNEILYPFEFLIWNRRTDFLARNFEGLLWNHGHDKVDVFTLDDNFGKYINEGMNGNTGEYRILRQRRAPTPNLQLKKEGAQSEKQEELQEKRRDVSLSKQKTSHDYRLPHLKPSELIELDQQQAEEFTQLLTMVSDNQLLMTGLETTLNPILLTLIDHAIHTAQYYFTIAEEVYWLVLSLKLIEMRVDKNINEDQKKSQLAILKKLTADLTQTMLQSHDKKILQEKINTVKNTIYNEMPAFRDLLDKKEILRNKCVLIKGLHQNAYQALTNMIDLAITPETLRRLDSFILRLTYGLYQTKRLNLDPEQIRQIKIILIFIKKMVGIPHTPAKSSWNLRDLFAPLDFSSAPPPQAEILLSSSRASSSSSSSPSTNTTENQFIKEIEKVVLNRVLHVISPQQLPRILNEDVRPKFEEELKALREMEESYNKTIREIKKENPQNDISEYQNLLQKVQVNKKIVTTCLTEFDEMVNALQAKHSFRP